MLRVVIISAAVAIASNAALAKDLTAAEQIAAQWSARDGVKYEVGHGSVGIVAPRDTTKNLVPIHIPRPQAQSSPSLVDLSALPPGYHPTPDPPPSPGAYSKKIEARAYEMFPYGDQREERGRWMAEQEQRLIANEINRSKPLIYPAR